MNNQTASHGFTVREKSTLFIANMDLCLIILGAVAIIYVILKLIVNTTWNKEKKRYDTKESNRLVKKCVAIYEDMEGDGWMQIINSFYMKIAVFAFLQLTNLSFDNWYYSLSSVLAILSALYCVYYPIRIALVIRRGNLKSKAYYKKFGGIWDEYKEDRYHTASFEVVVCLKKLFIAMALVFLQH